MFPLTKNQLKGLIFLILGFLIYQSRIQLLIGFYKICSNSKRPSIELFLGNSYVDLSLYYKKLADYNHQNSLKKFKSKLNTAKRLEKASIMFVIGTYYKCGRGVPTNSAKAEKWFLEAKRHGYNFNENLFYVNQFNASCQIEDMSQNQSSKSTFKKFK